MSLGLQSFGLSQHFHGLQNYVQCLNHKENVGFHLLYKMAKWDVNTEDIYSRVTTTLFIRVCTKRWTCSSKR